MDINKSIVCISQKSADTQSSTHVVKDDGAHPQTFHKALKSVERLRAELFTLAYPLDNFDYDILRLCTRFIEIFIMEEHRNWTNHRWPYISQIVPQLHLSSILECHNVSTEDNFQNLFLQALKSFIRILNGSLVDIHPHDVAKNIVSKSSYQSDFEEQKKALKKELFSIHPDTGDDSGNVERIPEIKKRLNFLRNARDPKWVNEQKQQLTRIPSFFQVIEGKSIVKRREIFRSLQEDSFIRSNNELYFSNLLNTQSGKIDMEQESPVVQILYPYLTSHMKFLKNLFSEFTYKFDDINAKIWKQPYLAQYAKEVYTQNYTCQSVFGDLKGFQKSITTGLYFYLHPKVEDYRQIVPYLGSITGGTDDSLHYGKTLPLQVFQYLKQQYSE